MQVKFQVHGYTREIHQSREKKSPFEESFNRDQPLDRRLSLLYFYIDYL